MKTLKLLLRCVRLLLFVLVVTYLIFTFKEAF